MLEFGTDGIRGVANVELSPEIALGLGFVVAEYFGGSRVLMGRDTRISGEMLGSAFTAGVTSAGVDVGDLGVFPTGGVAFAARHFGEPAAVISASHNPYLDNGIKIFSSKGRKLSEDAERTIENRLTEVLSGGHRAREPKVGRVSRIDLGDTYLAHIVSSSGGRGPENVKVVLDCAHGAAFSLGPRLIRELGCSDLVVIGDGPDGTNINHGVGSTHLNALRSAVLAHKADLGLAFDGDADRLLCIDETGSIVDGDHLMAIFARDLKSSDLLNGDAVVATVMSNLGLELALAKDGVSLVRTAVGDKYVTERLEEGGFSLGGEQSGHIVFPAHASTGDGLLTAAKLLSLIGRTGLGFAELARSAMTSLPQRLRSVSVESPKAWVNRPEVLAAVSEVEESLGNQGRVLVRPSGTEPVVRVMVEASSIDEAERCVDLICKVLQSAGESLPNPTL